jgi:hypothetical protein
MLDWFPISPCWCSCSLTSFSTVGFDPFFAPQTLPEGDVGGEGIAKGFLQLSGIKGTEFLEEALL